MKRVTLKKAISFFGTRLAKGTQLTVTSEYKSLDMVFAFKSEAVHVLYGIPKRYLVKS